MIRILGVRFLGDANSKTLLGVGSSSDRLESDNPDYPLMSGSWFNANVARSGNSEDQTASRTGR